MHEIEPYYLWRDDYIAAEDERSPFFETQYSEFYFDKQLYNFLIHPQWDDFGSTTMYIKVIYTDYDRNYSIIELIGEWNDAINNDIMLLFTTGITDLDDEIAQLLRRSKKPVFTVVNKVDNTQLQNEASIFYGFGLGEIYPISSMTGSGTGDLLDEVITHFEDIP